mmetsp:Transcript_12860/g.31552  ORF Transcript_12860/g.31552 Transcript_12860/m.31552 type:complete len:208 (-) Transcript_12860:180-803(-)
MPPSGSKRLSGASGGPLETPYMRSMGAGASPGRCGRQPAPRSWLCPPFNIIICCMARCEGGGALLGGGGRLTAFDPPCAPFCRFPPPRFPPLRRGSDPSSSPGLSSSLLLFRASRTGLRARAGPSSSPSSAPSPWGKPSWGLPKGFRRTLSDRYVSSSVGSHSGLVTFTHVLRFHTSRMVLGETPYFSATSIDVGLALASLSSGRMR